MKPVSPRKPSRLLSVLLALTTAAVLLAGAIAVPILYRPFYYLQINALDLPERTDLSQQEIRDAFDQVMDYCTGVSDTFSTGVLRWSDSGRDHFADVRGLFLLDLQVLMEAALLLIILLLAGRITGRRAAPLLGRGPAFWAGAGLGGVFLLLGGLAALDFNRAFPLFHAVFFPGKDNWIFDPDADQIITILPQELFRNCALLILVVLVAGCALLIVWDLLRGRKDGRQL